MNFPLNFPLLPERLSSAWGSPNIRTDVIPCRDPSRPKALVYYKTDSFGWFGNRKLFRHSNTLEIALMADVLSRFGFSVDVIDRKATWKQISALSGHHYELYIGNAAGNSAPFHERILEEFSINYKIYYGAGPEPGLSAELVQKRHDEFKERTGVTPVVRRLVTGSDFEKRYRDADAIFCIGETFCADTYKAIGKPVYPILPASAPISLKPEELRAKKGNHFLFMGGTGCICKGLDLVLEAFDGLSELQLDVLGPTDEKDFMDYYQPLLSRNPQIKMHGFTKVMSSEFQKITRTIAFNVFPSCSEGCATSVTTCMRRGVIPVINYESGVDVKHFGIAIPDSKVETIRKIVLECSQFSDREVRQRCLDTYTESFRYSDTGYVQGLERALLSVLGRV